jgi:hypothetical protein
MKIWQKPGRWNISCGFAVLGKVIRNRGRFLVVAASFGDDRHVVVICLTLRTSKPGFISPSQISPAGVSVGRWRITAFMGIWDFGKKKKKEMILQGRWHLTASKPP